MRLFATRLATTIPIGALAVARIWARVLTSKYLKRSRSIGIVSFDGRRTKAGEWSRHACSRSLEETHDGLSAIDTALDQSVCEVVIICNPVREQSVKRIVTLLYIVEMSAAGLSVEVAPH